MKNLTIETFHRWTLKYKGYEITKTASSIEEAKQAAKDELRSLKEHIKKIKDLKENSIKN